MSIFSKVPRHRPRYNNFNLSYPNKFTAKTGLLYPVYKEETVPGDIFFAGSGIVIRSQPIIAPVFTNYFSEIRYFYVPNRIIWDGFKEFLMDQQEGKASLTKPNRVHPYLIPSRDRDDPSSLAYGNTGVGSIYDFLGSHENSKMDNNALPFRAYNLIWNEYYRDQNLQDEAIVNTTDGADVDGYQLLRANWRKDYLTSALPWTQRGSLVDLPAIVKLRDPGRIREEGNDYQYLRTSPGDDRWSNANWARTSPSNTGLAGAVRSLKASELGYPQNGSTSLGAHVLGYNNSTDMSNSDNNSTAPLWLDPAGTLGVDINIRDLRFATAVQRFLEKEAQVGGGRYADFIRGIYGVNIGDATLQRPLYLGGARSAINVSPVEQTSSTDSVSPQGTLAGKGYMSGLFKMNRPTLISEHGWIIGMMVIRPEALYWRGLDRHMIKRNRFDYLIPGFQHLGEQEVYNHEVYEVQDDNLTPGELEEVNRGSFGYTSRQAEYKSHPGECHGEIRTSLKQYALSRGFQDGLSIPPALNSSFITCEPDEENIFAVSPENADSWIVDGYNYATVERDLDKYPAYGL